MMLLVVVRDIVDIHHQKLSSKIKFILT